MLYRYGPDDWHDANLVNNMNGIPVLLDWDNWSGDPTIPDDIRTLACLASSADRAQALSDKSEPNKNGIKSKKKDIMENEENSRKQREREKREIVLP